MTNIDLEAIRAKVEARRLSAPSRRRLRPEERDCDKLLAYVDALQAKWDAASDHGIWVPRADYDALRAAAGKVVEDLTNACDDGIPYGTLGTRYVREIIADLRKLLGEKHG